MTNRERETILKALKMIHEDDDYYGGMDILAKMVGLRFAHRPEVSKSATKLIIEYHNQ